VRGEGRNGERRNEKPVGEARIDGRGEGQGRPEGQNRGEGRNGNRRDNRREAPAVDAPALGVSAPVAETSEAAEGQRRERRGRGGDNRRRQSEVEGNEVAAIHDAANIPSPEVQDNPSVVVGTVEGDADNAQRAPRERRSRDRYGRDRRERAPREGDVAEGITTVETPVEAPAFSAPEAEADRPTRSYFSQPAAAEPASLAPVMAEPAPAAAVEVEAPRAVAPVIAEAPKPVAVRAPMEAPTAAASVPTAGLPKVTPYTLSMDDLHQVAQTSGLEWVNSNASKVAEVQAAIAAEPKPVHVPREPKPVVVADEGALVLVETRKDLSTVTLPFEGR
jgi:ribonuclease E